MALKWSFGATFWHVSLVLSRGRRSTYSKARARRATWFRIANLVKTLPQAALSGIFCKELVINSISIFNNKNDLF